MEDRVVEICVCVGPCARALQALPLAAAQECDMLHQMRNTLLILQLVHTPCMCTGGWLALTLHKYRLSSHL